MPPAPRGYDGVQTGPLVDGRRLSGTNPYGKIIKQELEDHYGEPINHGRLYQNLEELVEADLVTKLPLDGRTNVYRLTDGAESQLRAHRRWEDECLLAVTETSAES
ncbi:helix-turn-helix transcriptional regulator [Haladaptatus sp. R4]|uniref:helix-turn-helix transcriptional regulator n=1 Tax=Haladaptatus sp. R4 TaxID=1679489 RepID=UPI001CBB46CA|nr:helix-turn-helix transcriptional regulator [Haladaptatus sp. R4]